MPLAIKTTRRDELVENSIFDRVLPRILPGYSRGKGGGGFKITPRPVKPGIGPMDFSISDYAEPVAVRRCREQLIKRLHRLPHKRDNFRSRWPCPSFCVSTKAERKQIGEVEVHSFVFYCD